MIDDFLCSSPETTTIFALPHDFSYKRTKIESSSKLDVFHPNDIEPLSSELAGHFPDFRPGDLLISLRGNDLVAVLDPQVKKVRWWSHGPWRQQHDPDFGADGKIRVYNNNARAERSELIGIEPRSRRVDTAFSNDQSRFYSVSMDEQQHLPNGTAVIVSPYEGRVLETFPTGEIVVEFN